MEESGIQEAGSARSLSLSRWVDGSEVDSESPPWSIEDVDAAGYGEEQQSLLRRRLVKKPRRVDSLDVEAMAVSNAHGFGEKVPSRAVDAGFGRLLTVFEMKRLSSKVRKSSFRLLGVLKCDCFHAFSLLQLRMAPCFVELSSGVSRFTGFEFRKSVPFKNPTIVLYEFLPFVGSDQHELRLSACNMPVFS